MPEPRQDVLELDVVRTALILLDYQNYSVHPDGYWASVTPGLVERIAGALARTAVALAAAREARMCVIHVQNGQAVEFGQPLFDLEPALAQPLDAL